MTPHGHELSAYSQTGSAIHVIAGLEVRHGGPSYSVPRLCEALASAGAEIALFTIAGMDERSKEIMATGYRERRFAWEFAHIPGLRRLRKSTDCARELQRSAIGVDVIHNHGLWLMPNIYAGWAASRAQTPLVISPRGMLSDAALHFSGLKKRLMWLFLQGSVARGAACIHATSEAEYKDIRAFGLPNPVAIIGNGIDLPQSPVEAAETPATARTVLSLGRIHPKKGLDYLLRAWVQLEPIYPDWRLRIVGPGETTYRTKLQRLAVSLGLRRASIEEAIYGQEKLSAYHAADIFVLPSLNENFGNTVAESLSAGTPVIATMGTPWSRLAAEGCGWWIDHGTAPLAASLMHAMAMPPSELKAMGAKGRAWMKRDFSWDRVAESMLEVYRWLNGQSPPPSTVRFN